MTVHLEALDTHRGQALLLHYGSAGDPRVALVDGGPRNSYDEVLRPRLEQLRHRRGGALEIDLVVVSRAVDDHALGILDLCEELVLLDQSESGDEEVPYLIDDLWHNSWDDLLGSHAGSALKSCRERIGGSDPQAALGRVDGLHRLSADLVAHVPQGRRLRQASGLLDLHLNQGLDLITNAAGRVDLGHGLSLTVLAPSEAAIDRLREECSSLDPESILGFVEGPLHEAANLVLLAETEDKRMLLAGGASADLVMTALEDAGMSGDDLPRLDLVAFSPGGADQAGRRDLARRISASCWLLCGDGEADPARWEGLLETLADEDPPTQVAISGVAGEVLAGGLGQRLEKAFGRPLMTRNNGERFLELRL